jgi:4-methylaminobutanoate oxidase (formaldehyde-forming)
MGAVFGELAGWERAQYFVPPGARRTPTYSFGRADWFELTAAEHRNVRENVGLFDMSGFGKILVQGRAAERELQRICASDVGGEAGRIVYTQWLNERGGIEADVTVTRLSETAYLVMTAAATLQRDLTHLRRTIPVGAHAFATDVSNAYAALSLMGPRSRELLARLTDADVSNEAFPFGASREIDLGYAIVRASRITYVGELGFELLIPADVALHVFDTIRDGGAQFGLRPYGFRALDSLRLEKAYRSWGHDISDEDTSLEAGLAFTHAWDKSGGFIGRDALLRQREEGTHRRLAAFLLDDSEPILYHNEPILRDGAIVGRVTSGWFAHTCGRAVGLGYVRDPDGGVVDAEFLRAGAYQLEVANERFPAQLSVRPPYDPTGARIHG